MPLSLDVPAPLPRSRAEQLADDLTARLLDGPVRAGDRIGTLEDLRAQTGYGRATVSEAVRLLRERGVLEIRPGRGGRLFAAEDSAVVRMRRTLLAVESSPTTSWRRSSSGRRWRRPSPCTRRAAAALRTSPPSAGGSPPCPRWATITRRSSSGTGSCTPRSPSCAGTRWSGRSTPAAWGILRGGRVTYGEDTSPAAYITARAQIHQELVEAIIAGDQDRIRLAVARHNHDEIRSTERVTDDR